MKPTDIRVEDVTFGYEDHRYRTPIKFGGVALDRATILNVYCVVRTVSGKVAKGFGSMPLGNVWSFPSKVLSVRYEPKTENNVVSYEAILQVDNAELVLRPGMTASATIISEKRTGVLLAPNLALREFDVPDTKATHVRFVALENQCTGFAGYAGELDNDPLNETDCAAASDADLSVRAAELQLFE